MGNDNTNVMERLTYEYLNLLNRFQLDLSITVEEVAEACALLASGIKERAYNEGFVDRSKLADKERNHCRLVPIVGQEFTNKLHPGVLELVGINGDELRLWEVGQKEVTVIVTRHQYRTLIESGVWDLI